MTDSIDSGSLRPRRTRSNRRTLFLCSLAIAGVVLASCGDDGSGPAPTETSPTPDQVSKQERPSLIFGEHAENPFLVDVSEAPIDPNSRYYMEDVRGQISANVGLVPINTEQFNSAFVVADETTPRTDVVFDNCQQKTETPSGLYDGPAHFKDVPIPPDAVPAKGTDGALAVWQPATDQMWEFWQAKQRDDGSWQACWGGRIDEVSTSDGLFPHPYGTSASGLATVGSMISLAEAEAGQIDHALYIGLLSIAKDEVVAPANRTDGTSDEPSAPPMGTRLRLDPQVDVDALDLTPLGRAVAKAAQRYGFIVSETSHTVAIGAESGLAIERATGKDPWEPLLGGVPWYEQLRNFPWDQVHVIRLGYGSEASEAPTARSR